MAYGRGLIGCAGVLLWLSCGVAAEDRPAACAPAGVPVLGRGRFVFFSNQVITAATDDAAAARRRDQLEWLKRFRICLTNGYANFVGRDLDELHAAGCELFIYRWFNGYYQAELAEVGASGAPDAYYAQFPGMTRLFREIRTHPEWLLNPGSPVQGGGAAQPAYFYDYANAEFRAFFATAIRRDLDEARYDGVFFDYIGDWALPPEVAGFWAARNPRQTYNQAGLQFLRELRAALGNRRIFGNQAYRLNEPYYEVLDYDASESLATSFAWGREAELNIAGVGLQKVRDTFYRPWDGPDGITVSARERLAKASANPRVRVCDISYLQPLYVPGGETTDDRGRAVLQFSPSTDRPAVFYSLVVSLLLGGEGCASDWYAPGYGRDDVYFLDLGQACQSHFVETPDVVTRYFANGFVALTRSARRAVFRPDPAFVPPGTKELWDTYQGIRVHDWASQRVVPIVPAYYPSTQSLYPSGRIYLYLR